MRSRFHLVLLLGVAIWVGCSEQPTQSATPRSNRRWKRERMWFSW